MDAASLESMLKVLRANGVSRARVTNEGVTEIEFFTPLDAKAKASEPTTDDLLFMHEGGNGNG